MKVHLEEVKDDLGKIAKEATSKQARKPHKSSGGRGRRVETKPSTSGEGASVLQNKK